MSRLHGCNRATTYEYMLGNCSCIALPPAYVQSSLAARPILLREVLTRTQSTAWTRQLLLRRIVAPTFGALAPESIQSSTFYLGALSFHRTLN
jgi:hypothetical protein